MVGRIKAQLPVPTNNPQKYIENDEWVITQKLDGQRVIIVIENNTVTALNRNGEERQIPEILEKELSRIKGEWIFDGELLKNPSCYWIFDIIKAPTGEIGNRSFEYRNSFLQKIFEKIKLKNAKVLPCYSGLEQKQLFLNRCIEEKVEGVIFNNKSKPYVQWRTENLVKYKFINTVDCIVTDQGINNKDNFVLSVYRDGTLFECGKVSAITGDGPKIKIGDVVEVTVLYATDSGKLYQPVKPKIRTDKNPQDCTYDQIEFCMTNKKVIYG